MNRPQTFTCAEAFVEELSIRIITDGRTYAVIAQGVGCAKSTIQNLATGKTKWPRPATLFGLITFFKLKLAISE